MRKDVEHNFGILKHRGVIFKTGIRAHANTAADTGENAANAPSRKRARPQGVSRISNAAKTTQDTLHSGVVQYVVELLQERNTTLADVLNCKAGGRAFPELSGLQLEVRELKVVVATVDTTLRSV